MASRSTGASRCPLRSRSTASSRFCHAEAPQPRRNTPITSVPGGVIRHAPCFTSSMAHSPSPSAHPNVNPARKRQQRAPSTNEGYDRAVHAGQRGEERDDVFERLERTDVDLDGGLSEDVDPEGLLAQIEGKISDDGEAPDELLGTSDLDEQDLTAMPLSASAPSRPAEEEDGGTVSPEELGEQFLRGAAQQQRRTRPDDRESKDDVDLLGDSVHQVSLFDHNFDPLRDPRLPRVAADETVADGSHHTSARAAAKRTAIQNAQERSAGRAEATSSRSRAKSRQGKPTQDKASPNGRESDK